MGGINFQNGDSVAKGRVLTPCKYAAFVSTVNGYYARPSAYGIKAFDLGGHRSIVPVDIVNKDNALSDDINLNAYAVLDSANGLHVTVLNKAHGKNGKYVKLNIRIDIEQYPEGRLLFLKRRTIM